MSANGRSILLVDDDQEIRELLETYLSRAGFQVRSVSRGADFRQALCEEEASLAILDVMLPDEDGFSLCRWIRSHQRLACMPIIMLTASSDEADRVIGLELGADDYPGKPFSPRELLARIKA
ncbi:two-component system response regulator GltR, partial [Pseudomonas aeruginosa]